MEIPTSELGTFSSGEKRGTLIEMFLCERIGQIFHKSFHYKIIEDGTREEYLINFKENELVDSQGNIWKKVLY